MIEIFRQWEEFSLFVVLFVCLKQNAHKFEQFLWFDSDLTDLTD